MEYQFTWPDKKKSVLLANAPINKTLRPVRDDETTPTGADSEGKLYCGSGSVDFDNTENLYIEGDNLEVLKLLQETYLSKIKMIYIDPPYNTGNDFVYEDDFAQSTEEYLENSGQFDEDGNRMVQNTESNGRFHTDWLNMIYPRLKLAKALLTDDGVIFISIDDNELENIKKCCEEVFGESNFLANIVWKHTQQSKNDEPHFSRQYNHTLVYAKMKSSLPNFYFKRTEEDNKNYSNPDADPKGMWRSGDVRSPNYRKTLRYTITAPNGNIIQPPTNGWRWSEESLRDKISTGEIKFKSDNSGIIRKIYLCDQPGRTPENLWEGQQFGTTRQAASLIKNLFDGVQVFDTPKPIELIKKMLEIATGQDSIVLDFFSGSATTAHAVMQLNAEDGGHRKFIMVQLPEKTDEKSEAYKFGYKYINEIGKERIRRAAKKIAEENPETKFDGGFRVLKCDSSNMKNVYYNPAEYEPSLFTSLEDNIKEDRTSEDLLFQVMLAFDPTMLFMAAALANIDKKLDSIKEMQQEMMDFLVQKEKAELKGNLTFLYDVFNNYKYNWNNEMYKNSNHTMVLAIKKEAEAKIVFYREQIIAKVNKKFLQKITGFIWTYAITNPGVNALRTPVYAEMVNIVNDKPVEFSKYKFDADTIRSIFDNFSFNNARPITKAMIAWWAYQNDKQPLLSLETTFEIEHIYARNRNEKENSLTDARNVESLGNKALLEKRINIRASDYRFADKKKYYEGFTNSKGQVKEGTGVVELLDLTATSTDFTEDDIIDRYKKMIDCFINYLQKNSLIK